LNEGVFSSLSFLLELDLSSNSISSIGKGVFEGLNSLSTLDLYFNCPWD